MESSKDSSRLDWDFSGDREIVAFRNGRVESLIAEAMALFDLQNPQEPGSKDRLTFCIGMRSGLETCRSINTALGYVDVIKDLAFQINGRIGAAIQDRGSYLDGERHAIELVYADLCAFRSLDFMGVEPGKMPITVSELYRLAQQNA